MFGQLVLFLFLFGRFCSNSFSNLPVLTLISRIIIINVGAVTMSIDLSTTFAQHEPGKPYGAYEYSRAGNPTRYVLVQ